jgi:hypothetical protein
VAGGPGEEFGVIDDHRVGAGGVEFDMETGEPRREAIAIAHPQISKMVSM